MKKILIALDYNPSSEKVAKAGYALAKAMHADVTLLNVITDPVIILRDIHLLWVTREFILKASLKL